MVKKQYDFDALPPLDVRPYRHVAQYYETDQMGIVHHSNYIRWMEEARVELMEQLGFGYARMEAMGILCPVLSVSADYKAMVHFYEAVNIECRVAAYTGLKLIILYQMTREKDGVICTLGESRHGFLDADGHIISLKRAYPEVHALLTGKIAAEKD